MKKLLSIVCLLIIVACVFCGCVKDPQKPIKDDDGDDETMKKQLHLAVGDSYDFYAQGYIVDDYDGDAVICDGNVARVYAVGTSIVSTTRISDGNSVEVSVISYEDAASLGDRYNVDKGMFKGKNVIVFGDSITDGCLLDPFSPNGLNYVDTYYAKLCRFLQTANDPTDLLNSNFACGATTMSYVPVGPPSISGVERVAASAPVNDNGRIRNPAVNVTEADLCIIFYGTNDFAYSVPASAAGHSGLTDLPTRPQDALTVKGALYYMLTTLRQRNPHLKLLVLPCLYRRISQSNFALTSDMDIINTDIQTTLSDYTATMREVSEQLGAKFVDWSKLFNYENFGKEGASDYSYDGLHPNIAGHQLMYEFLLDRFEETNTL